MIRAGAAFTLAPRAHHVARTVLVGAQERSTTLHALLLGRLARVEGRVGALRVSCDASTPRELRVVVGSIPIAHPFPDVAGDIVQSVAVRRKLRDRPDASAAVFARVRVRGSVPDACSPSALPSGANSSPHAIHLAAQPASSGEFPLRFGRQSPARPFAYATASSYATCTTGYRSRPDRLLAGPSG